MSLCKYVSYGVNSLSYVSCVSLGNVSLLPYVEREERERGGRNETLSRTAQHFFLSTWFHWWYFCHSCDKRDGRVNACCHVVHVAYMKHGKVLCLFIAKSLISFTIGKSTWNSAQHLGTQKTAQHSNPWERRASACHVVHVRFYFASRCV